MRGYIRRRGTQSWQISVELSADPVTGERKRTFRSVKGTRREAERELTALSRSVDTGVYIEPGRETVAGFLRRWLRDYAQSNVAPRTYQRYESIVEHHLVPALGSLRLADLRPAHIIGAERHWLESGRLHGDGGLSPRSVLHHHRVLHAALTQAVRWHDLAVNPAAAVTAPRAPRTEMRVLDAEQAAQLMDAASGSDVVVPVTVALFTGLRMGELLGLRWRDCDLDNGRISVQQAVYQLRGGGTAFGSTKTHRSRRPISLPADAVEALRRHKAAQAQRRLVAGAAWLGDFDLVFDDGIGGPLSPDRLRAGFQQLLRAAHLPVIRFHDLRHTMATLMLASGEHPKVVSERLGHASVMLTLDTYSHVLPGLQEAAAERLADTLARRRR